MSGKPTLSPSLPDLLALRKKKDNLTAFHINFLTYWHEAISPKMFGFRGVRDLTSQLDHAIKLLKDAERDWEKRIRDNATSLQFTQFFHYTAVSEGVDLPTDFEDRYNYHKIKGALK